MRILRCCGGSPGIGCLACEVTLITRERYTTYSGMLPGVISGLYRAEEAQIDAARLAALAGARLRIGEATGLDAHDRRVHCRDGAPVPYHLLSINTGSTPGAADIPGTAQPAIPVKPIDVR